MKKKETLTISLLAILATGASWFVKGTVWVGWLGPHYFRGLPLPYWSSFWGLPLPSWKIFLGNFLGENFIAGLDLLYLIIDLIFWFLLLAIVWWIVRKLKTKGTINNFHQNYKGRE